MVATFKRKREALEDALAVHEIGSAANLAQRLGMAKATAERVVGGRPVSRGTAIKVAKLLDGAFTELFAPAEDEQ